MVYPNDNLERRVPKLALGNLEFASVLPLGPFPNFLG